MFRTKRGRQDLLIQMNEFKHQYYDRKKLVSLGWKEVETVDGRGINSWNSLKNKLTIEGRGGLVGENGWPKVQLAINNEEIVGLQESLVEGFRGCRDQGDVYNYVSELKLESGDSRLYQEVGSYAGLCNSIGWTFCVDGLMSGVLPDGFTGVRRDAMVQWNEWWTAAHVEIGGNDSVSKTPCGEKLFLICGSYQTSRDFNNVMGTPQYFMDLIKRGPSASGLGKDVWFFIPTKDNVLCQPSLCAHAVLTFTKGLSLVTGWEARDQSNQVVVDRTLGSFSYGVRKGAVKRIVISNKNKKAVLDWAKEREVSTGGASDVTDHVQSFANSGLILKTNNKRGNRRKWGGKRETETQSNENIVYSFLPPKDPSME